MKNKENAIDNYIDIIHNSWTWAKLTEKEQNSFIDTLRCMIDRGDIKGTYAQRNLYMSNLYTMFLSGVGYDSPQWRNTDPDAPLF